VIPRLAADVWGSAPTGVGRQGYWRTDPPLTLRASRCSASFRSAISTHRSSTPVAGLLHHRRARSLGAVARHWTLSW